ncbi:MAG: OmpA family protein [Rubritepida sp.]|nr:OmpA family protein [Rubritepida sp.]
MRKTTMILLAGIALAGAGGCTNPYDPGQRALGGAGVGALGGAALGGALGGGRGAVAGALLGGATGAVVGAGTTPQQPGYYPPQYAPPQQPGYYK